MAVVEAFACVLRMFPGQRYLPWYEGGQVVDRTNSQRKHWVKCKDPRLLYTTQANVGWNAVQWASWFPRYLKAVEKWSHSVCRGFMPQHWDITFHFAKHYSYIYLYYFGIVFAFGDHSFPFHNHFPKIIKLWKYGWAYIALVQDFQLKYIKFELGCVRI